jgi:hypothetical protein
VYNLVKSKCFFSRGVCSWDFICEAKCVFLFLRDMFHTLEERMDLKIQSGKLFVKLFVNNNIRKQHWDRRIVFSFKLNKKEILI